MKKNLLIVINNLDGGGAEKSLISLLNELEKYRESIDIDLLVPVKQGLFYHQIPSFVNIIDIPRSLYYMSCTPKSIIKDEIFNFSIISKKLKWSFLYRIRKNDSIGIREQKLWDFWKNDIEFLDKTYDVAISYLNGYSNYYIIDKVKSRRKILWLHNEYQRLGYSSEYDRFYYDKADKIVTISELCRSSFLVSFPELAHKIEVIENLSSGYMIRKMADEPIDDERFNCKCDLKLLTIGRLVDQKNYELAIDTARYMCDHYPSLNYKWFVIGQGVLEHRLKQKVKDLGLDNRFIFLGVKANPYPYIKNTDIFVQTSRYEGKSIVLDEAKILSKPIVVTDYNTVYDVITEDKDGIIVKQRPEYVCEGIMKFYNCPEFVKRVKTNLLIYKDGNLKELDKYLEVMLGNETIN